MHVGIIGAGVSGLAAARVMSACGHDVTLWEAEPDLGGVWSASRAYPSIGLQNDKVTYGFSDFPMPQDAPEFPGGTTVRSWLTAYAARFGLTDRVQLESRVLDADPVAEDGWAVTVTGPLGVSIQRVDWLIVANGIFSKPAVPRWPGRDEFEAAGGVVLTPSEVGDGAMLHGRRVLVVGWGKSACDLATAAARIAASTTIVARTVRWKVPRRMGSVTFGHILLTRMGEHLLWGSYRSRAGRLLRVATRGPRAVVVRRLGRALDAHVPLARLGVAPRTGPTDIDSLVTDGFFEAVDDGRLSLRGHVDVRGLGGGDAPTVALSDGASLPVDVVVAATGYDQDPGPFAPQLRDRLLNAQGGLDLFRAILPERVDRLAYVGWMHSFRSPIGAELQAMWTAAAIAGIVRTPSKPWTPAALEHFWLTRDRAAAAGTQQIPKNASITDLDQLIDDFAGRVPLGVRLREWSRPLDPAAYAGLLPDLVQRIDRADASRVRGGRAPARA